MGRLEDLMYDGIRSQLYGDLEGALNRFNSALVLSPNNAEIYAQLGLVYGSMDRYDDAEDCCRKAIELEPDNLSHRSAMAITYHEQKKYDFAEIYQRDVVESNPTDVRALGLLNEICFSLKKYDDVIELSSKIIDRKSEGEIVPRWLPLIKSCGYDLVYAFEDWKTARRNREIFDDIVVNAYKSLVSVYLERDEGGRAAQLARSGMTFEFISKMRKALGVMKI